MRKPLIIFVLVALFIGLSCDTEEPKSIFDPNATAAPDPVITSVIPPDSAYGGTDERFTVTIVGENFGDNADEVLVNFGSKLAIIRSLSETQIAVTPPVNFSDSLRLMVSKFSSNASWDFGTYEHVVGGETVFRPYKLKNPTSIIPGYDKYASPQSICVDGEGNLIICYNKNVDKMSPDGNVKSLVQLKGQKAVNAQIGPDGDLYYGYIKYIMKVDTTDNTHTYNSLSATVKDLDFDQNGNLFVVDANSIYLVNKSDLEETVLTNYKDTTFSCMRIYDNEMYLAGNYVGDDPLISSGPYIWKYSIDNNGNITSDLIEVIDWSATKYGNLIINNITFSTTGEMLIGTRNYSILSYDMKGDGSIHKVYDELIGTETAHRIMWGVDDYLYMTTHDLDDLDNVKILKINLFEEGSPYFGRN